ncbi:MAG: hypothetical protein MJA29_01770, partial [Candidatus Omnitrophica bacterium]|nr:hypothetical protein [Candidatus Omnitrophota bacterium]
CRPPTGPSETTVRPPAPTGQRSVIGRHPALVSSSKSSPGMGSWGRSRTRSPTSGTSYTYFRLCGPF